MDIVEQLKLIADSRGITEEVAREIVRLRQKVRERGQLLAAVYNCEAAMKGDIPDELLKQIDELVFFPKRNMSANASVEPRSGPQENSNG